MARNYAALPYEYLREMSCLSDAEFGRLCRALIQYSADGTPIALSGNERFFQERIMMQEDRYRENYDASISQKSDAGKRSAEKRSRKKNTVERRSTPLNTVERRSTPFNETNKTETETETDTETKSPSYVSPKPNHIPPNTAYADLTRTPAREERKEDSGFDAFWAAYPRKTGDIQRAATEYLIAIDGGAKLEDMLAALEWQRKQDAWTEQGGRFIPSPEKWLRNRGWTQKRPAERGESAGKEPDFIDFLEEGAHGVGE